MVTVHMWNTDKTWRCPVCHTVAIDIGKPKRWAMYECCNSKCGALFSRFPKLATLGLVPDKGIQCSEHKNRGNDWGPEWDVPEIR